MLKQAIIYARVSSKEQEKEGYSIPAQMKLLQEYAVKNELQVLKEFSDTETAKKAGREQFGLMLEYLKKSKANIILVEKTDRLYRNFSDYVTIDNFADLEIHLVKEGEVMSKDSKSHQKFIHGIKVLMAKNYIDNLSEETKKGLCEKAESGYYPGPAPIGYLNIQDETGKKIIVPDEKNAPLMKQVFEMYDSGNYSIDKLVAWAKENDLRSNHSKRTVSKSRLAECLKKPFYYGPFLYNGKLHKGLHEPIIGKALWDRVQKRIARGRFKTQTKHAFQFSGLLTCGDCGSAIVAEKQKGKYTYYHCSRNHKSCSERAFYVREEKLAKQFEDTMESIKVPETRIEEIVNALKDSHHDKNLYRDKEIARLRKKIDLLRARKDQAYIDKLDDKITDAYWQELSNKWQEEIHRDEAQLAAFDRTDVPYYESGRKILELAKHAHELYLRGTDEEKKELLKLVHSNSRLVGGNIEQTLRSPFNLMAEWASCPVMLRRADSNCRPSD